jgi:hypothetical protein
MKRLARTTLYGSIAAGALFMASGQSFAAEPGDFQSYLAGLSIGIPLGAAPPPGLYGFVENFVAPGANGTGQNSAANNAFGGRGATASAAGVLPGLVIVPGWNVFGGSAVFGVIQPFYSVQVWDTNCLPTTCNGTTPVSLSLPPGLGAPQNDAGMFENMHNTVFTSALSWNWKNGWFTSLGFAFNGPDGTKYNGTNNQDYWTFSPNVNFAYIDKTWKLAANFDYDIHTASKGHTGFFAGVQQAAPPLANVAFGAPNGCVGFNCPGIGYRTGDQLFIDWSAEYRWGKLAFGPAGDFKYQPTADSPGSGYSCATLAANATYAGAGLTCGRATNISLGGILGYDFGLVDMEVYAVDSVYNKDDFKGWNIFTRFSFKLDNPAPAAPAAAPMVGKAH